MNENQHFAVHNITEFQDKILWFLHISSIIFPDMELYILPNCIYLWI